MYTLEEVEPKCVVQVGVPIEKQGLGVKALHMPTGLSVTRASIGDRKENKAYALVCLVDKINSLTEPLPCPFCGCEDVSSVSFDDGYDNTYCYCTDCLAESGVAGSDKEAIDVWNKRF